MFSQGNSQLRFTLQKGHSVCYVPGILGENRGVAWRQGWEMS